LSEASLHVLRTQEPADKVTLTESYSAAWQSGEISDVGNVTLPQRPARPARPELRLPNDMPRRRKGGAAGRMAFLHAIAHIECNAIDLAWDIVARFTHNDLPRAFYDDWVQVAADEARHFDMLQRRMAQLGGAYGDLPAHDGLWQAASDTSDDLMARLALVPMVLEARGLDTTPGAVEKLRNNGDAESAEILLTIGEEEVPHVAAGVRWFRFLAERRGLDPIATFHEYVRQRFKGYIKPPFNYAARNTARMDREFYEPLTPSP
jgi:uncharacterized ferritin-like protein (DUF455 family)